MREWFRAYWSGSSVPALQYRLYGTEFQVAVWEALFEVPSGETRTYGQLARRVGRPDAARAVGAAVGQNPIAIVAPCHRIVGADGSLTGFGGGLPRKKWLLAHEAEHAPSKRGQLALGPSLKSIRLGSLRSPAWSSARAPRGRLTTSSGSCSQEIWS